MFKFACFLFVVFFASAYGHKGKKYVEQLIENANQEAALMPQELNPAFSGASDSVNNEGLHMMLPVRPVLPAQLRFRRDLDVGPSLPETEFKGSSVSSREGSLTEQVKHYSRVVACLVLVVSAVIEVVVYVVEAYQTEG